MAKTLEELQEELEAQKGKGIDRDLYNYNKNRYMEDDRYYRDQRNQNYNEYKNTNPYETDIAKSIMNNYRQFGGSAAKGAMAESAASNNGQLDSFGAANANRQMLDYVNEANTLIAQQYETRQDRIMQYLDRMRADAEGYYTRANNQFINGMNYDLSLMDKINEVAAQINANKQAELDRQAQVAAMAKQHQYDLENLAAQNKYNLQNLAAQSQYDLQSLAKQNEYNRKLAELQHQYELELENASAMANNNTKSSGNTKSSSTENVDDSLLGDEIAWEDKLSYVAVPSNMNGADLTKGAKKFASKVLGPKFGGRQISNAEFKNLVLNYTKSYDIEKDDIKTMGNALGLDTSWLKNYANSGLFGFTTWSPFGWFKGIHTK
jgi:hypothetical protein